MNRSRFAAAPIVIARILAASISVFVLLAPCWTKSAGDTGPAQAGPAEVAPPGAGAVSQTRQVAHRPPAPPQAQPGMRVERQVLSPSGKLRIEYMRDRQQGLRQIALQDVHNPANTTVLAQYKRNAWVVISPDDAWIVLNNRDAAEGGAQLYHRLSTGPLKYEVPAELRGTGNALPDIVWQTYLSGTQQDPGTDRTRVTIDGIAWEPDSHRVTLSVAPIATKDDTVLPEPWTCTYDVTTKQIEPPAEVAEGPANDTPNDSADAPSEVAATQDAEAAPAGESSDLEGEKFPATREEPITIADANELELSDVRYAINEMLARHGANFKDARIRNTFAEFSWYQPRTDLSLDEIENEFSDVEKHNISVLRRCRDAKIAASHREERKPIRGEPVEEPDPQRALRGLLQGVSDALNGGN
jgi:YARHG domain-containing protein